MIAIVCPECLGDTLWRYPNFQWARNHVPFLPPRCYVSARVVRPSFPLEQQMSGHKLCPEPNQHIKLFKDRTARRPIQ